MKILHVIPFFAPAWGYGGSVRLSYDIATKLAKDGHNVTVLSTDTYDKDRRIEKLEEKMDGVDIIRFKNISNTLAKKFSLYLPLGFKKYLEKHIEDYDVVHLHAFFTYQNVIAGRICQKANKPYILHLTESPVTLPILGKIIPKKVFNFFFGKKLMLGASKIIVVSETEKIMIAEAFPEIASRIIVIPIPIIAKEYKNKLSKKELRSKYGLDLDDNLILSLSRLSFLKRIDLAIKALGEIEDEKFKLIVVGPDEAGNQKKLEDLRDSLNLQKRVIFWGVVEGQEKDDLYSLADIYILLSQYESASLTALEALQHNVPVCLSKSVGVASEVLKYDCGNLIVNSNNSEETAKIIEKTFRERDDLAKNCQKALRQFDINSIIGKIEDVYKKITPGKKEK